MSFEQVFELNARALADVCFLWYSCFMQTQFQTVGILQFRQYNFLAFIDWYTESSLAFHLGGHACLVYICSLMVQFVSGQYFVSMISLVPNSELPTFGTEPVTSELQCIEGALLFTGEKVCNFHGRRVISIAWELLPLYHSDRRSSRNLYNMQKQSNCTMFWQKILWLCPRAF
jgi:hypothetical protein